MTMTMWVKIKSAGTHTVWLCLVQFIIQFSSDAAEKRCHPSLLAVFNRETICFQNIHCHYRTVASTVKPVLTQFIQCVPILISAHLHVYGVNTMISSNPINLPQNCGWRMAEGLPHYQSY